MRLMLCADRPGGW